MSTGTYNNLLAILLFMGVAAIVISGLAWSQAMQSREVSNSRDIVRLAAIPGTAETAHIINLKAGTYEFTEQLVVASYVQLLADGLTNSTVFDFSNAPEDISGIVLTDNVRISYVSVRNAAVGVQINDSPNTLVGVTISGCTTGVKCDGGFASLRSAAVVNRGGVTDLGYWVLNGGELSMWDTVASSRLGEIGEGLRVEAGGYAFLSGCRFIGSSTGIKVFNGTTTQLSRAVIIGSQFDEVKNIGLEIGDQSRVELRSCSFSGAATSEASQDIVTTSVTSYLDGFGNIYRRDMVSFFDLTNLHDISFSDETNDKQFITLGELAVGAPEQGYEAVFGEGDSYTRGMSVFKANPSGEFTDVTSTLNVVEGTTSMFDTTVADNIMYVGGTITRFFGLKMESNGGMNFGSGGEVLIEYWNGSAWTSVPFMCVLSGPPYSRQCRYLCTAADQQVRFGLTTGWVKNTVNSVSAYWVRIHLTTAITTAPVLSRIKLHSNRAELNADGFYELFGNARVTKNIPYDLGLLEAAANSPANSDVYISNNIGVGRQENQFQTGVLDRIALTADFPEDLDTSYPLVFRWRYFAVSGSGDVHWVVRWVTSSDYTVSGGEQSTVGDSTGDAGPKAYEQATTLITTASVANKQLVASVSLDLNLLPQDAGFENNLLWISLERDGTQGTDTLASSAVLIQVTPSYTAFRTGAHLTD